MFTFGVIVLGSFEVTVVAPDIWTFVRADLYVASSPLCDISPRVPDTLSNHNGEFGSLTLLQS